MAITSPWIGSSAKAETGKANMSEAGKELKMSTPFWMSEMKGKSMVSTEADVEFIVHKPNALIGGAGGWSSKPLMAQTFNNIFPASTSLDWKTARGTLLKPSTAPIQLDTILIWCIVSESSGSGNNYGSNFEMGFTGTPINSNKYKEIKVTVLNTGNWFTIPTTPSSEWNGDSIGTGMAKPWKEPNNNAANAPSYYLKSSYRYLMSAGLQSGKSAMEKQAVNAVKILDTNGANVKLKLELIAK